MHQTRTKVMKGEKKKNYNKQSPKHMLKKILTMYLSMVIIYQEQNIIKIC